tara:strand:- start:1743 stop:2156 length:414 start_codon:yes stop_codon:yes gene_type:complete
MLTTVDSSEDDGIGVQRVTVELPAIGQLENTLTHLNGRTVNFVKEENHRLITSLVEPVWRIERGGFTLDDGKTNKVTLGHLRCTPLNDGQTHLSGCLIDNARFTDTVATTEQNRFAYRSNVGRDGNKGSEVNSHFIS